MASSASRDYAGGELDTNSSDYAFLTGDFSVGLWFNSDNNATWNAMCGTTDAGGWAVWHDNAANFGITCYGIGTRSITTVNGNEWYYGVVQLDDTTQVKGWRLTTGGLLTSNTGADIGPASGTTDHFVIGRRGTGDTTYQFDGHVMHVQIWNRVITEEEVLNSAYSPGSVTNGLIGYWPSYGQLSTEPDLSASSNHATATGTITASTEAVPRAIPIMQFIT